jgi:hypothetical protein
MIWDSLEEACLCWETIDLGYDVLVALRSFLLFNIIRLEFEQLQIRQFVK